MSFRAEFEREAALALPVSANVLRVLSAGGGSGSARDISGREPCPGDRAEDDHVDAKRCQPMQQFRPRDRRPEQGVERKPPVRRQVRPDGGELIFEGETLHLRSTRDAAARGIAIVIVEQDISRSLAVADRFYCLLEGKVTLAGRPGETSRAIVMKHYFGS